MSDRDRDAPASGESTEDLLEDAPCGVVSTDVDGTILRVNRTFEAWTGRQREELLAGTRFQDLLTVGGRIYHDTHYAPLLQMQGFVREIALELVRADGSALPAMINSSLRRDASGTPRAIVTTLFDATDRRRYEQELQRAHRREREIATQLQSSLLSGELPVADGLEIGVAYRSAAQGLDVGGDWYDAFWLDEGSTLGLVVGDVVGRGLDAAATMGQLRSAVRALASTGLSPGEVLEALDRYAHMHAVGRMATCVYASLDLRDGECRYACAAHPPPILLPPESEPQLLWEGRSLPLDSGLAVEPRGEATCHIDPGGLLVLYTDGLVERRSESIDVGLKRLGGEIAALRGEPTGFLARTVSQRLTEAENVDDTCVLAVRLVPGGSE